MLEATVKSVKASNKQHLTEMVEMSERQKRHTCPSSGDQKDGAEKSREEVTRSQSAPMGAAKCMEGHSLEFL